MDSAALLVHCQIALGRTQKELGDLLGMDRRTIQRWQKRGSDLMPDQVQTLANALQPVTPIWRSRCSSWAGRRRPSHCLSIMRDAGD